MINKLGETLANRMAEQFSRRSFIAKCSRLMAVLVAGQLSGFALSTPLLAEPLTSSNSNGEDGYHHSHCATCNNCGLYGKPCSHCGTATDADPCPSGTISGGSWYACCCAANKVLYQYQDCCGKSNCPGEFCANSSPRSAYNCFGGYWCTRVIMVGWC